MMAIPADRRRGRERFALMRPFFGVMEILAGPVPTRALLLMLNAVQGSRSRFARGLRYVLLRRITRGCGEVVDVRANVYLLSPET